MIKKGLRFQDYKNFQGTNWPENKVNYSENNTIEADSLTKS